MTRPLVKDALPALRLLADVEKTAENRTCLYALALGWEDWQEGEAWKMARRRSHPSVSDGELAFLVAELRDALAYRDQLRHDVHTILQGRPLNEQWLLAETDAADARVESVLDALCGVRDD